MIFPHIEISNLSNIRTEVKKTIEAKQKKLVLKLKENLLVHISQSLDLQTSTDDVVLAQSPSRVKLALLLVQ